MSNCTLVSIPETAFETSSYSIFKHTSKIDTLLCSEDGGIYGVCETGGIYRFKIDNGAISGYFYPKLYSHNFNFVFSSSTSKLAQKGSRCMNVVMCGSSIALLQCVESPKKKTSVDNKQYHVAIYDSSSIDNAEDSSWDDIVGKGEQSAYVLDIEGVVDDSSVPLPIHMVVNGFSHSISILYLSNGGCMKWIKISNRAELLFERSFDLKEGDGFPNAIIGQTSSLWVFNMVSGNSKVEVWQSRYGVRPLDIDGDAAVIRIPGYRSDEVTAMCAKGKGVSLNGANTVVALRQVGPDGVGILACSTHVSLPDGPTYSLSQFTVQVSQCPYVLDTLQELRRGTDGRVSGGKELWSLGSLVGSLKRIRKSESDDDGKKCKGTSVTKRPRKGSTQQGVLDLTTSDSQVVLKSFQGSGAVKSDAVDDAAMVMNRECFEFKSKGVLYRNFFVWLSRWLRLPPRHRGAVSGVPTTGRCLLLC